MPLNILLADDSVPAQNMGKKILVDAGYHVRTVSNGLEALRKIAETTPDIAILDIFMPGYTGLELCERLRASEATAALPVILTVGRLEPYRPEDGEQVHANAVIVKPFAAAELIAAVRSLIGAAPLEVAAAVPVPPDESHAAELDTDPLQETSFEAAASMAQTFGLGEAVPTHASSHTGGERQASYGESATLGNAIPWASQESTPGGVELLSHADFDSPQSLVFDPDAGPTPFSASVINLPSELELPAENAGSAYSDFKLELEGAQDTPAPELEISNTNDFSFSAAVGAVEHVGVATQIASEPQLFMPEPAIAYEPAIVYSQEPATGGLSPLELELPTSDAPLPDPWHVPNSTTSADEPALSVLEIGELAEEVTLEVNPLGAPGAEVAPTSHTAQPDEDEEARRLAFEELFNSTEPFPVEEFYAASDAGILDTLPSLANRSEDHSGDVTPDAEIEALLDSCDDGFVAPELDPYLMHAEEPREAATTVPERDPQMDDSLETDWSGNNGTQESTQAATANSSELDALHFDSPQPAELSLPISAAPLEPGPTEAPPVSVAALPSAPETLDPWTFPASDTPTEIVELPCEAARIEDLLPTENIFEIAHPDAERAIPEAMHSEAEFHVAEPTPVREPEPDPAPGKTPDPEPDPEPLQDPEPDPETAPVPVHEPEPGMQSALMVEHSVLAQLAETQSDTAAAISSAPSAPLDEAERIHQAVDRVFDRFKRLLVAAIVRELARPD